MPSLRDIESQFFPDYISGGRVALFFGVQDGGPLRLVKQLTTEYRPYAACKADELPCIDRLEVGDFTFLGPVRAEGCMVVFDSEGAIIRRPIFRFYGMDSPFDAKLEFKTTDLPAPLLIAAVIDEIARFARLLGAASYAVHHETNAHWEVGDFSDATLIYASDTT